MIEITRKRLLRGGLFFHVYVLVAWFCAASMNVRYVESPVLPHFLLLLFSVFAVSLCAVVLYVAWVRVIARDLLLRVFLISPMAVTVMTAIRLSAKPFSTIKWFGSILAVVVAIFGVVAYYSEMRRLHGTRAT